MTRAGGEAYLELRARYLRLLTELRRSRDHNPETLEAFERILGPDPAKPDSPRLAVLPPLAANTASDTTPRHVAA